MKDEPVFDHEKLDVYRLSIEFQAWVGELLDEGFGVRPKPSATKHLDDVSTSISNNCHSNGPWRISLALVESARAQLQDRARAAQGDGVKDVVFSPAGGLPPAQSDRHVPSMTLPRTTPTGRRRLLQGALVAATGVVGASALWRRRANAQEQQKMAQPAISPISPMSFQPIARILSPEENHWVGDGFFVSTIFSPHQVDPQLISPFLLMDHAPPKHFPPAGASSGNRRRGVGEHPHRGFETVTFAYAGEIEHRDSHGGGGKIGSGGIQWMTAASGVVHEEFHSQAFTERGGVFEMVQLWVNLPAKLKMTEPRYQSLADASFPRVSLGDGTARLIAGQLANQQGPAQTHSPVTVFDLEIAKGGVAQFALEPGTTTLAFVVKGSLRAQDDADIKARNLIFFDRNIQGAIHLAAEEDVKVLVLNGQPLNEPVFAHGPFVMNTRNEIVQAIGDYQKGLMGTLAPKG